MLWPFSAIRNWRTDASLRPVHPERNLAERTRLGVEQRLTGWKPVDAQHVREDVGVLCPRQRSRLVQRHRHAHPLEQIVERRPFPVVGEPGAGEGWRRLDAGETVAVAAAALRVVQL